MCWTQSSRPNLYRPRTESAEVIGPSGSMICENAYHAEEWSRRLNEAVRYGERRAKLPHMLEGYRKILRELSGMASVPAPTAQRIRDRCAEMLREHGE